MLYQPRVLMSWKGAEDLQKHLAGYLKANPKAVAGEEWSEHAADGRLIRCAVKVLYPIEE